MKTAAILLGLLLLFPAILSAGDSLPSGGLLDTSFGAFLTDRLVADGFDRATVEEALGNRFAGINRTTLAYAIVYRETKADYSGFLSSSRLKKARKFLERKRETLRKSEARYQVPPEVTAAILMIESDFGNFRKLHRTFNVFSSLLWAERPENFETVRKVIRKRLPDVTDKKIRERTRKKAAWGYEQLKSLLRIAEREKIDPLALEGSWAGAFGMPQFIPTSYWDYAVDGNGDRRVDLFEEDDAIFSIGNYLNRFGWRAKLSEEKKKSVLRRYNNSGLYVDTVLAAAARLE